MNQKVKLLIVDDSAVMRKILTHMFSHSDQIEIIGQAPDPFVAREIMLENKPDVMILDIEMPKMDGLTFLEKVMEFMPTRTLIFSGVAPAHSQTALKALELGAIDVLEKPAMDSMSNLDALAPAMVEKVLSAAKARIISKHVHTLKTSHTNNHSATSRVTPFNSKTHSKLIAIASSTGGTEALKVFLSTLPPNPPPIIITQHMPPIFTKAYAETLNTKFPFEVKEGADGDKILPGRVLIAPGNYHMELEKNGIQLCVRLNQKPILHGVRPAADYMMKSVAQLLGKNAIGIVLTGMGKDGAQGLLSMKQQGAVTFAQSEKTCVVFGMPHAAIQLGAVDHVLDLADIGPALIAVLSSNSKAA